MCVATPRWSQAWMSPTILERASLSSEGMGSVSLGMCAMASYKDIHQILLFLGTQRKIGSMPRGYFRAGGSQKKNSRSGLA